MGGAPFSDSIFGFHAQQAVEKALKAWLAALGAQPPLTHNLAALLSELEEAGADVEAWWDLVSLNAFAVQFRYEAFDAELSEYLDRPAITAHVEAVVELVSRVLDPPDAP